MTIKRGLAFHCHHDSLVEYVHNYDERVKFIKTSKPKKEQSLRLRLFQLIPDEKVPGKDSLEWEAYDKAWVAYDKARAAYNKAWEACEKTWEAYIEASATWNKAKAAYIEKYRREIEELHKELCPDCTWNGKSIFKEVIT